MMKAIVLHGHGGPEVLNFEQVAIPIPQARDIVVKVKAVGVNPVDWKTRSGPFQQLGSILGWDASGIVHAVGAEATKFKEGDEVYFCGSFSRDGAYAEYCAVDERLLSHKPKSITHEEAAALPLTSLTAWEAMEEQLHISPSRQATKKTVLIIAGAGGVGSIAIQLAKKVFGLTVIATASRLESSEWCKKMGADYVIDHHKNLKEELRKIGCEAVNYIFNAAPPSSTFKHWHEILSPLGSAVSILPISDIPSQEYFFKRLTLTFEMVFARPNFGIELEKQGIILHKVAELIDRKELRTTLNKSLSWQQVQQVHREHEEGKTIGKVVMVLD